jgi:2'-5' RNA ligase
MHHSQHSLRPHYNALWEEHWPNIRRGAVATDPLLARKASDGRRGLTVIARPDPAVAARIEEMLHTLAALEPQQYYYPQSDFHLTVLSLFTATEDFAPHLAHMGEYRDAAATVLAATPAFTFDTVGITLAAGAVLAQGFPHGPALETLRDGLRAELRKRGLGHGLDQRYRLVAAHSTLVRFAAPLNAPERFAQALAEFRNAPFGRTEVSALELVFNDWYMSRDTLRTIETFQLLPMAK